MNRFSRLLHALSPTCAVLVAAVAALASGHSASAKTSSFSSPSRFQTSSRDAFVRVGVSPVASASKARAAGAFSTLLGSTTPSPRGFMLAAAGTTNVSFTPASVDVNEGDGIAVVTITRTSDAGITTTVNYTTVDASATAGQDYSKSSGTVTFQPGETSKSISILITDDTIVENQESFNVTLSNPMNSPDTPTVLGGTATVNIFDNETSFSLDQAAQTVNEGDGFANVIVKRAGNTNSTTAVDITTTDQTATSPADYGAITQTLNFGPGDTSMTVSIPIVDDTVDENVETFAVMLSNPGASTGLVSPITQQVTILDNDSTTVFLDRSSYQVNEGDGTLDIGVTRGGDFSRALNVDYRFANGTIANFSANNGQDFTGTNSTLSFAAGQKTATIPVPIIDDTDPENNESFSVTLSNPLLAGKAVPGITPALGSPSTTTVTIIDNDPAVTFEATNYSVNENDGSVDVTVNRTGPTTSSATVDYTFGNGFNGSSATNGQDYTGVNGTLNFAANQTSKTITIPILQDSLDENNESFRITLSNVNPDSVQIGPNTSTTVTIVDDDATPSLSIADASQLEPNAGSATENFTVTLSAISGRDVSVAYATSDGSATDGVTSSGTEDKDYTATSGVLTIPAGSATGTISVPISSDTEYENDEGFLVTLSQPFNVSIDVRKAVGTILNDDPAPSFAFTTSATSVPESAGTVTLSVTRTGLSNIASSVTVSTANGSAISGSDYTATSKTINFAPTDPASKSITIPILEDSVNEATESFTATLSNPTVGNNKATIGTPGTETITITDNDPLPVVSIGDAAVLEGDTGTANLVFPVSLDVNSAQTVQVSYATADGTATTATNDYVAQRGTVTFAPGEINGSITVVVNGDGQIESNETLSVILSNPQNATIASGTSGKGSATGTILNDDTPPTQSDVSFAVTAVSVNENDGKATLTVTRSTGTDRAATIDYATSDGTAIAGSDYTQTSGTLGFGVGASTANINVPILNDQIQEPGDPETFAVTLSNPGGNAVEPAQNMATVSITDDEAVPTLSVADTSVDEGNSGKSSLVFTVSLQPQSQKTITVDIATLGTGTAVSSGKGQDYVSNKATLTFAPGVATRTFAVQVIGDGLVEGNDTVDVALSNAQGAPINQAKSKATGTINNDDVPGGGGTIVFLSSSYSVNESAGSATITLGRSGNIDLINQQSATVHVATGSGTATPYSDYRPVSATLTFAAGQTTKSFLVPIVDNTAFENDENVSMSLSDVSGNAILGSTTDAMLTIVDDDQKSTAPRADSLTPTASVGSPFTVTATYSSDQGVSDLTQVLIQVGGNQGGGGLRAIYDTKSKKLSLAPTTGGSAAPKSHVVLANQFGSIDCSRTTVERIGNSLRVTWTLRPVMRTPQNVFIGATSSTNQIVFVRRGTWRPSTSADSSANGS